MTIPIESELRSQLAVYKKRVAESISAIERALISMRNPYVSFSAGKDSTVLLHLVRSIKPNIPAVYFDSGYTFPESYELIDQLSGIILHETNNSMDVYRYHGLLSEQSEKHGRSKRRTERYRKFNEKYGFDGVFLGLRSQESRKRALYLRAHGTLMYVKVDQIWQCNPLAWWSAEDIWTYIDVNQIPYNRYYDLNPHINRNDLRMADWSFNFQPAQGKWVWLKKTHPKLFNKFAKEFPEVKIYI